MQLIKKLADQLHLIDWEAQAIEMSPQFHMQLIGELVDIKEGEVLERVGFSPDKFCNLPIIFVQNDKDYFKILNKEQYKLRIKYNDLLRIYRNKYGSLKIYINHSYKIENSIATEGLHLKELSNLVFRLNNLEHQIRLLSQ